MSRALLDTAQPAFWENDAAGRRAIGRIAGVLFSAGGLATVPAYRLPDALLAYADAALWRSKHEGRAAKAS